MNKVLSRIMVVPPWCYEGFMLITRLIVGMLLIGMMVVGAGVAYGQAYPNKPIRIVTSGLGGGSDFTARLIAQGISGPLGQPVIVDNRASGIIPAIIVSKAPPDGYTLLVAGSSFYGLLQKVPYDPVKDFSPVTSTDTSCNVLVVLPSSPVRSVKELIALAKAKPGVLNYSMSGADYIAGELFNAMAGVKILPIAYQSTAAAVIGLLNGEVQLFFGTMSTVFPLIKSGKMVALAVTSSKPSAHAPDLPTIAETLPGYESCSITGIFAPANTPATIINQLNREIVRLLNTTELKERFLNVGTEAVGSSPGEFAAQTKSNIAKLAKVIKDAGIKVN